MPTSHHWNPAGSSGLGPNFSPSGAVPFPRVLQGMWEEEVGREGGTGVPVPHGVAAAAAPGPQPRFWR